MKQTTDYEKYRGKCKEMSEELISQDGDLRLVRGFYYCPYMNKEEQHWWCEDKKGNIIDPTKKQFPSKGAGIYREFNGIIMCSYCNKEFNETDNGARFEGSRAYCSYECFGKDIM